MKTYSFYVKGWGVISIEAPTKVLAKKKLKQFKKNDNTQIKLQPTSHHK